MVMIQTPTTRLVFRSDTTCGSPTTTILESRVAMKIPTVVTVRTTHLYSKKTPTHNKQYFSRTLKNRNINSGRPGVDHERFSSPEKWDSPFSHTTQLLSHNAGATVRGLPAQLIETWGRIRPLSALISNLNSDP